MDGMTVMSMEKVKVAVRVRPFSRREIELGTKCVVEMDSDRTSCTLHHHHSRSEKGDGRKPPKNFAFDNCFWSVDDADSHYANQADVYNALGVDILDNAFQGYNACIFAYGQTGSGKSFTMMGTQENKGIIPRLCDNLFERIANNDDENRTYKVEVSYMEIYNEKVHDLLDPKGTKQNLRVREHNILGPYVDGLSTLAVSSFHDIDNLMQEGNKSRTVAATNMNNESSRSHAVFSVILTQTLVDIPTGVTGEKVAKVSLVDLAGSERAVKTGAVGERLKEGSNINKSLTTLGLVISKLADQSSGKAKDNKFVPYRDSVLTWLLKDNLGGNSKTVMVATISPASDNYEETLSTLRYADRAKRIVNHAVINEDPNARIIRELRAEVEALKEQLKCAAVPHRSTKREDLHEKLTESERIMQEMSQTWEQKLLRTERIHHERQQALEKMGISVQASGIKVEQNKYYLVNLNADPSLNELLVYYLKEHTLVGRAEATVCNDIQLSGLGIMPEHCIITIENCELHIESKEGARTCVNGSVINSKTILRNGDRVLWGNNHFFRVNCPKPNNTCGFDSDEDAARPIDYEFAREELMMKELSNDPIQSAMKALERQHEEDKQGALEKQRLMFERQLQMLRNQMSPSTPYSPYVAFDPLGLGKMTPTTPTVQSKVERWAQERHLARCSLHGSTFCACLMPYVVEDEIFKKSLSKLREDIVKANTLVREANFLAEEMGKQTEFGVTLQIPAANLSPNREPGAFVSEPAIMVKRKHKPSQVWSMEKLENKLIDMRDMYEERKEKCLPMKDEGPPKGLDPFYESQDNHKLIGVANLFLEVLLHEVKLAYQVPIISQQGEVAGRLQVEISRVAGNVSDRVNESSSEGSAESTQGSNPDVSEESAPAGKYITCRVEIKQATGLPQSLSHFVFCHYTFPFHSEPTVAAPVVNPDVSSTQKHRNSLTIKFDHVKEFTVNVTEEFVEHCHDRALSIEVWGHRSAGFGSSHSEWEVESQLLRSRSLVDRWGELKRKIELWVEIHELNEQGEYSPVEVLSKPDVLTGGVFQLRQGQQRRILLRVKPVQNSGTLPIICEAITSIAVGSVCARSKLQKGLDSYQEEDLTTLREKWTDALTRRREYLGEQIQRIINKQGRTDQDIEREQSLIDQWMSLMEEGNAVLVPSANSGIPGAPAEWDPPVGMEKHIPVLFLDLNADDMSTTSSGETASVVGANLILPKEHGTASFNLPIVKYCEKDVCAVASWDSSIHDSLQLNRLTPADERVYMILKATVRLSHPATMELVLRKRLSVNIYKKQSLTEKLKKKIGRQEPLYSCGVAYEVVSNIPKASEELEDRESLAQMAATGEDTSASDGETYIEKYTRGVSAVESILTLDRLRQEVAVKELLAAQGRPLRKTASVPNISHISRLDSSMGRLDEQFHSESMLDISSEQMDKLIWQRANNGLGSKCSTPEGKSTGGSPFGLTRPTFLNLNLNLNLRPQAANSKYSSPHDPSYLSARRLHDFLNYRASVSPQAARLIKPMRTVLEEQYQLEAKPLLRTSNQESVEEEEEEEVEEAEKDTKPHPHKGTSSNNIQTNEDSNEEFSEYECQQIATKTWEEEGETSPKPSSANAQGKEKLRAATPAASESKTEVGTPSTVSSGYGSQAVSSTTLFSEDSISVRSISVDETPDSDFKLFKEACQAAPTASVAVAAASDGERAAVEMSDGYDATTSSSHGLNSDDTVEHHHPTDSARAAPLNDLYISEEGLVAVSTRVPTDDCSDSLTPQQAQVVVKRRLKSAAASGTHRMSYPMTASNAEKHDFANFTLTGSNCGSDASLTLSFQDDCSAGDDSSFGSRADLNRLNDSPLPDWAVVGESVLIRPYNTSGTIAFVGPTVFANGAWVGVDLDTPSGKNDGSVNGVRYFTSRPRHGIFVRHDKLILDKRGRNMKSRQSLNVSANSLRKGHGRSDSLSSSMIDVNTPRRGQLRGDGASTGDGLDNVGWNLRRSRSRGEGLHEASGNRGSKK